MKTKSKKSIPSNLLLADSLFAKCCFTDCNNKAEWIMGTWQCCDECAKTWITQTEDGWGFSKCGTSRRTGQESILAHNVKWNLKYYLVGK